MVSSDFRKEAREKLSGKWGKATCIALAYTFIFAVLGIIESLFSDSIETLISLIVAVIEVPLSLGLIISLVRLFNDEDVKAFDFLSSGFSNFGKSWEITWQIVLKMILPVILSFISFMILTYGIYRISSSAVLLSYGGTLAYRKNCSINGRNMGISWRYTFSCFFNLECNKIILLSIIIYSFS